jgi:imidazolonepropionase-like amidohydrolase
VAKKAGEAEKGRRVSRFVRRAVALQAVVGATWAAAKVRGVLDALSEPREPLAWKPEAGRSVLLAGCDVIDVLRGRRLRERGILYRDGVITGIVATRDLGKASADRVFDCTGLVAIPGLINCHCHTMMPGAFTLGYDLGLSLKRQVLRNIEECPVHGVTTVRDTASMPLLFAELARRTEEFELLGPRMIGCGSGIKTPGGYPDFTRTMPEFLARRYGQFTLEITDPESGREVVRLLDEQGARFFKLAFDDQSLFFGHKSLTVPDDETVRAVIKSAHALGKRVCVHQTQLQGFRKALRTGIDDFEHLPADGLLTDGDVAEFMKCDHHLTPTATVGMCLGIARDGHPALADNPMAESLQKLRERTQREIGPAVAEPAVVRANDLVAELVKAVSGAKPRFDPRAPMLSDPELLLSGNGEANIMKLYEAGAKFCCGNDGGVPFTWPGTLFLEMEMLEAIGLAAADVLRAATVNAADLLGVRGELGSLEAGKSADIVLLSADPLADIRAVERVEAVFRSGALLHYGPRFYLESPPG